MKSRVNLGRIDLMKNYSFFEVEEKETRNVLKSLNGIKFNGRKVVVEVAGEDEEHKSRHEAKNVERKPKREAFSEKPSRKDKRQEASRKEKKQEAPRKAEAIKKQKPSREERGYTKARGKKDDWKQFFMHNDELRGPEPDFSEEGWVKPSKKK